jgi:hypothetical protein
MAFRGREGEEVEGECSVSAGFAGAAAIGAPHEVQNFSESSTGDLHLGQGMVLIGKEKAAPHIQEERLFRS